MSSVMLIVININLLVLPFFYLICLSTTGIINKSFLKVRLILLRF